MIKVVADKAIPFLSGVLEPYAQVKYLKGGEISNADVADADALLIRTRTKCTPELLEGTAVSFIASATIGTDHMNQDYLKQRGISFASAPGCNAGGVMQYVHTALFSVAQQHDISLYGKTLGVIGVGNTGGRVAALAERLGFRVLRHDPPRAAKEGNGAFCPLDTLLRESDIITCHVPLDSTTRGMASSEFFGKMKEGAIFINASRGEVVDDSALLLARPKLSALVLDVWNGEPSSISRELISVADIATPHIAGYSFEGKVNGTAAVVQAFARHFGIPELLTFEPPHTPSPVLELPALPMDAEAQTGFARRLLELFPVYELDAQLRRHPESFESIRSEYHLRREFTPR